MNLSLRRLKDIHSGWKEAADRQAIFGFGLSKSVFLTTAVKMGLDWLPAVFFDNNPALHDLKLENFEPISREMWLEAAMDPLFRHFALKDVEVLSPAGLSQINQPHVIVFANDYTSIKTQLESFGLREYDDFMAYDDPLWELMYLCETGRLFTPLLEIIVSNDCTLRCRDCGVFAPDYGDRSMIPFQALCESMDLLFSFFGRIQQLVLIGGEPLMHSRLNEFTDFLLKRHGGKFGEIAISTNGTVTPSEAALESFGRSGRIRFLVSDYSASGLTGYQDRQDRLLRALDVHGLEFCRLPLAWRRLYDPEDETLAGFSSEQLRRHFLNCLKHTRFQTYYDGRLHVCHVAWGADRAGLMPLHSESFLELGDLDSNNPEDLKLMADYLQGRSPRRQPDFCRLCRGFDSRLPLHGLQAGIQNRPAGLKSEGREHA